MFDIYTGVLAGQSSAVRKNNPSDWELPLAGKLVLALLAAVLAKIRVKQVSQKKTACDIDRDHTGSIKFSHERRLFADKPLNEGIVFLKAAAGRKQDTVHAAGDIPA